MQRSIQEALLNVFTRKALPEKNAYLETVEAAIEALGTEAPDLRPADILGKPGSLIQLDKNIPVVIVPDLHGREDFFISLLFQALPDSLTVLQALSRGSLQILCLGDGFHAEARALDRWSKAFQEFTGNYKKHKAMDQEMKESLGLMEMVMLCKIAFPRYFHFLKGNHENIQNEEGDGNHPFRKFAAEGMMVAEFILHFYGEAFMERYAVFERSLPLFAVGPRFLASHAEPRQAYTDRELINARMDADIVLGLTWTDNGEAEGGSVSSLLDHFHPGHPNARYFTGHRTIPGYYKSLSGGRHLQIHNPDKFITAWINPARDFDPDRDIGEIKNISSMLQ